MRILVIGAGEVGFDVSRMLSIEDHDVVVVDLDPDVLVEVRDRLDVLTVEGNGTSAAVLEEAGAASADLLLAVTSIDEVNMIACMIGDRMGVETTVARIRSDQYTEKSSVLKAGDLGIDLVIHPEETTAEEVVHLLRRTSATDVLHFANEQLQLVGMRLGPECPVLNEPLEDVVREMPHDEFRIMAISRGVRTLLPQGEERLQANDQVFVLGRPSTVESVAEGLGMPSDPIRKIMILGGTPVGSQLARRLGESNGKQIKLIEPDRRRASDLAEKLPDVLVLNGDATDIDLLTQEGMAEMDAFVAVTDDEESNLVSCLLADHLEVGKTVALLSKAAYIPISQSIGLDAAVSKKLAVSREILRFLRGTHVLSVATVHGLDAEILEMQASPDSRITRSPLREVDLPRGVLIGATIRGDEVQVATGDTHIRDGDRAIVFVVPHQVEKAESYFE